ncbi:MAG: hypothetical protein RLZZ117_2633 [Cyanobacteriota bacterium]
MGMKSANVAKVKTVIASYPISTVVEIANAIRNMADAICRETAGDKAIMQKGAWSNEAIDIGKNLARRPKEK